jgi:hypothetical protein
MTASALSMSEVTILPTWKQHLLLLLLLLLLLHLPMPYLYRAAGSSQLP